MELSKGLGLAGARGSLGTRWLEFVWLALLYPALVRVPPLPEPGLDPSWEFFLTSAAVRHIHWGETVNFTFGPLGYLAAGRLLPEARVELILFALLLPLVFLALVFAFSQRFGFANALLVLAVVPLAALSDEYRLVEFTALLILFVVLAWQRGCARSRNAALVMGLLLGFALLLKVNLSMNCAALCLSVLMFSRRDERPLLPALSFYLAGASLPIIVFFNASSYEAVIRLLLCSAVALLAAAAVHFAFRRTTDAETDSLTSAAAAFTATAIIVLARDSAFRGFLYYSGELIKGYSSAMSLPAHGSIEIVAWIAGLLLVGVLLRLWAIDPGICVGFAALFALSIKHSFVRADQWHLYEYFAFAAIIGSVSYALIAGRALRAACFLTAATSLAALVAYFTYSPIEELGYRSKLPALTAALSANDDGLRAGLSRLQLPARVRAELARGPLAVLPWEFDVPYANALEPYVPFVPQLYSVYTMALDRAVASGIDTSGPPNVLLSADALDGRYLFADGPAVITSLWCSYRSADILKTQATDFLWLRRTGNGCDSATVSGPSPVGWDEAIPIPATQPGEAVSLKITFGTSLAGKAADVLWKRDAVGFQRYRSDGTPEGNPVRIIPGDSADGIIVQPPVKGIEDLERFFAGSLGGAPGFVRLLSAARWQYATISVETVRIVRRLPSL